MKDVTIQFPDGKFHTVQVYRFYTVKYNGREEYVIEYDDLTDNTKGCFSILDKEEKTFVRRLLKDAAFYKVFYNSIRFAYKKNLVLSALPETIYLSNSALVELEQRNAEQLVNKNKRATRQLVVYKDAGSNPDVSPYYLDKETSKSFGFICKGPYYHLSYELYSRIKGVFDVVEKSEDLGISSNAVGGKTNTSAAQPSKGIKKAIENIVIYEDVSPIREDFPYYISRFNAQRYGLKVGDKQYYHLRKEEFDVINRYAKVHIEKKQLLIIPQLVNGSARNNKPEEVVELNSKELETLDNLFEKLVDFEDYYSFFGIEDLRGSSVDKIFGSPRIIALSNLFNKGKECGNELAINLLEFLEGFRNDLIKNTKKF